MEQFDEPAAQEFNGVRINPRDVVGHLLIVWAIEYLEHKPTQFSRPDKPSDVIVVDVVDLDLLDPEKNNLPGLLARHVWWRQAKLIQALRPRVGGKPLLAYMAKGGASTGFNAPFVLNSATGEPAAVQRASEWFRRNADFQPSQPFSLTDGVGEVPAQPTSEPTLLERMTQQAIRGAARLPDPPQGSIPF